MSCGKDGKRNSDMEWRIYYAGDSLSFSSPRQQILHIRSEWHLMFSVIMMLSVPPSLWCLTVSRHSERWQECFVGKRETKRWIGVKNLWLWWHLTAFPHYGNRSFAAAQDDVLRLSSPRQQILHIRFGWWLTFPSLHQQILCCCFVWHLTEIIYFGF